MQATAYHSYLTPPDVVEAARLTNRMHAEATRGQSGHKKGPPHAQSYRVFVKTRTNLGETANAKSEDVGALKGHLSQ